MRIAYDAKRLFNNFTGLGNYSRFVVDALAGSFPQDEYWLYSPKVVPHPETAHFLQSPRFTIRRPEDGIQKAFPSVWRSFSLGSVVHRDGIGILHGLSNELPVTKPAQLKTIVTVHDLIFRRFPGYYNPLDVQIYSWKLRQSLRSADKVIAVSHQTAADLAEFEGVEENRLVVIHQGCHAAFKQGYGDDLVDQIKSKYSLPDTFVLCVGTLEKRKNAILLIKALSLMREKITVVIAGKPTPYASELRDLVSQLKLEPFVHFIYHVPYEDLPLLYRASSVFVYPSVFEGFGIPIVEAIASKVPVITSNGSCFSEAGGPNCIYVNPSNPEELAVAISQVLGDDDLRKTMVTKSLEYIARFEPPVIAGQLMKVYKAL